MVERVKNERNERNRWLLKTVLIVTAAVVLAIVFGYRFYHTVQAPYVTALEQAEANAVQAAGLESVISVERFVGDKVYTVTFGTYGEGEEVAVWLWDGGTYVIKQGEWISREEMKAAAIREHPERSLLRVSPGVLNGEYVWEVFSSEEEDGGTRKYYDYYRFTDGVKLETYRLSLERK